MTHETETVMVVAYVSDFVWPLPPYASPNPSPHPLPPAAAAPKPAEKRRRLDHIGGIRAMATVWIVLGHFAGFSDPGTDVLPVRRQHYGYKWPLRHLTPQAARKEILLRRKMMTAAPPTAIPPYWIPPPRHPATPPERIT